MSFEVLPKEIGWEILHYLTPLQLARCALVSKTWFHLANHEGLWRNIAINHSIVSKEISEGLKNHVLRRVLNLDTPNNVLYYLKYCLDDLQYGQNGKYTLTFINHHDHLEHPCSLTLIVKGDHKKYPLQEGEANAQSRFVAYDLLLSYTHQSGRLSECNLMGVHSTSIQITKEIQFSHETSYCEGNKVNSFRTVKIGPFEVLLALPVIANCSEYIELTPSKAQICDMACSKIISFYKQYRYLLSKEP